MYLFVRFSWGFSGSNVSRKTCIAVHNSLFHSISNFKSLKLLYIFFKTFNYVYIFIYLFKYLNPATEGSARINTKERRVRRVKKMRGIEAHRVKPPTPSRAIDALIGEEELNGKRKKSKKRKGLVAGPQPSYPGSLGRLLQRAGIIQ